ncbi:MAG TPA: TonB-dependent receptor, partial [Pyrinomonadaceae bacterium]
MRAFSLRFTTVVSRLLALAMVTLVFAGAAFAQAQASSADLNGTVTDPSGAVVPGATVTARDTATGITRTVTSGESGEYNFIGLPPGEYEITAEARTFKRTIIPSVRLTVGQSAELTIRLEVGAEGATVTVTGGDVELVETTRTTVSNTIDQQRIENLPVNERSATGFALTISTIGRDNGRPIGPAPTSGLNIGGQRGRSTLVQVDGSDFTDNSINAARTTVSQEAVQEFQVATNSYAPEFGRATGGIINVVTKRGTNDYTGNVFGFFRDKSIQANNPFAPIDDAPFRRTQFGATLGGPLPFLNFGEGGPVATSGKGKNYFFTAIERRQRDESGFFTSDVTQGLTASFTAPAALGGRTYNFLTPQQVQFATGLLPTNPVAALTYLTLASSGSNVALNGTNPFLACNPAFTALGYTACFQLSGAPVPSNTRNAAGQSIAFRPLLSLDKIFPITDRTTFFSLRTDHNLNEKNQLTFRFGYNPSRLSGIQVESQNQSLGQNDFSRTGIQRLKDTSLTAGLVSTLTNNIVNDFRFQYGRRNTSFRSENNDAVAFNISDTAFIGRELFSPVERTENRFQFADNLTWVYGDHTFKFGADVNFVNISRALFELNFAGLFNFGDTDPSPFNAAFAGAPAFTPVQSYGLGLPGNFIQGFGNPISTIKNTPLAVFAQDSWKLTKRLTINYGVRYDIEYTDEKAPVDFKDPLSGISLSAADLLAAQDVVGVQQGFPVDKNNIAPRFGFAFDAFGNGKTVIRGAFGLFYDHPLLAVAFNSDIADAAQQQQAVLTAGSFASTALLNAAQVFQGTVCVPGAPRTPVCAAQAPTVFTPGVAPTAEYQFGRQRFNDQTFTGFGTVLPFVLPVSKDFKYASALQANFGIEHQLTSNMSISATYIRVSARNLPHPTDLNTPDTALQIQNFQRFAGRLPTNRTEVVGFTIPVAPPGSPAGGNGCTVVIPGAVAQCAAGRVVAPAFANFFRPNAPNYFLTQSILNLYNAQVPPALRLNLTDFNNALSGSLRTPGVISPFGSINAQVSDGNSEYNALNVELKRRFANNFTFLASYTLSKSIDDSSDLQTLLIAQDPQNFRAERALSLFDQRHRFVFSGVLASPGSWRGGNGWQRFLADFTIAPILEISSGRPFNIITNFDANNDQSSSTDRPSVNPDGTLCIPGTPGCVTPLITNGRFSVGNLGRNMGVTHGYASLDLRVMRAIRFGERIRLDLIAEGFNL